MAGKRDQGLLAVAELSKYQAREIVEMLKVTNRNFVTDLMSVENMKSEVGAGLFSTQFFTRLRRTARRAGMNEVAYLSKVLLKKKRN